VLTALIPLCVVAPGWVKHLLLDAGGAVARLAAAGIPAIAGLLVVAHAAHGWALDLGARRSGASPATTRALRFGLYAAGWDLVVGPIGAVVVVARQGFRAASSIAGLGIGLPSRSARAFVRGCYHLDGKSADGALRASYVAAVLATAVGAAGAVAAAAYLLLL
jgi:hypothetical protein